MKKNEVGRIITVVLACYVLLSTFGAFPSVVHAAKFNIGDIIEVTINLNVRTWSGTTYPEITDSDYLYYAPAGTKGRVLDGPSNADGYVWWKIDFGPGLYSGWSVEGGLEKVVSTTISARIDSYSPSSKVEVDPGQSFTISVTFTNTGNTAWDFLAGASIWDSTGYEVVDDWSGAIRVQPGQQGSYSWTHTLSTPGEYWLQFGVWKDQSTLLSAKPSPSQNLIKVKQPTTISARIDSYSPSSKVEVDPGQSFTISVTFTNTGNTAWDFLAGASIWDSTGYEVVDDWSGAIRVQPGQQGSYSWTHTLSTPGEYWLQFGVWKDQSTLLSAKPSPSQNLIKVKQPTTILDDVYWLAKALMSEASVGTLEEQISVGWTVLNRLHSGSYESSIEQVVKGGYAYNQEPTSAITTLADELLQGKLSDPTSGATFFFSPISMPKEGESTSGFDVGGGLHEVPGTSQKVYFPSWAKPKEGWTVTDFYQTVENLEWVSGLQNVRNWYFMFYRPSSEHITKVLQVPYIHQTYDSPDDFVGSWACAPASAVMVLAFYDRIQSNPITVSYPSPHTSNYGAYISREYTSGGYTFSIEHTEPNVCGTAAAIGNGAWGYIWQDGVNNVKNNLVNYLGIHNIEASFVEQPTQTQAKNLVQQEIDAGRPLIARTYLTDWGHYVVIVGYDVDTQGHFWYKAHDPFGDKPYGDACWGDYGIQQPVTYSYSQMQLGVASRGLMTTQLKLNQKPNQPASLSQFGSDGTTAIPEGGSTTESTVIFKGTVSDPDGDAVKLEIELREAAQAFSGTPTSETISELVSSGSGVTINRYGLVSGDYHWQARAVDEHGLASEWVEFDTAGNTDFLVSIPDIGYAVIVAGDDDSDFNTEGISANANTAYQALRALGFSDERIFYLNGDRPQDIDGDGDDEVDRISSLSEFQNVMEHWVPARVGEHSPFILYLVGHGTTETFFFSDTEGVSPSFLDYWLGELPSGTQMLIVIDSCYSGSFITDPSGDISASNRVIVTSAGDDSLSDTLLFVGSLFSQEFWERIGQGQNVKDAFVGATDDANLIGEYGGKFWDPWLDDNGDAVGHSPLFLGDDGYFAAAMIIGAPGGPPSVGEGGPSPQFFTDCYGRNGGASILGYPINNVHRWGNGYRQDFRGGEGYEGAIMQPDGTSSAYAVYGSIWARYLTLGGAEGPLGYPLNDESPLPPSSISSAECLYNKFYGGSVVHHATGAQAGLTVFLGHGIFNKWEELGYGGGVLGLPSSDEREAPQSGAEGFDTTGVVCDFEGGHLYWHRTGALANQAFETHGAIDGVYTYMGGSDSWLGFPVTDEYYNAFGYPQSDFEGGYITTTDGGIYQAFPYATGEPNIGSIDPIDFGDVAVDNSMELTTIISNEGTASLKINSVTRTSGSSDFSYVAPSTPFNIVVGGSQTVTIRFMPSTVGAKSVTFTINSNDPDAPDVTFSVSGVGAASAPAIIYVPDDYSAIQAAVDAASPGDTIIVRDGTYTENIDVNTDNLTIRSENGAEVTIVQGENPLGSIFDVSANYLNINGFTATGANCGFYIYISSTNVNIEDNIIFDNLIGIEILESQNVSVTNNIINSFQYYGIRLWSSRNNIIEDNIVTGGAGQAITIDGTPSETSCNNIVRRNSIEGNNRGIYLCYAFSNEIYLNSFVENHPANVYSYLDSSNIWISPEEITYVYNGNTYTNYLGNYWSDYSGSDPDGDGIGDTPYSIDGDEDNYPLMEPFENYEVAQLIESVDISVYHDSWEYNIKTTENTRYTWYLYDINENLVHTYASVSWGTDQNGIFGRYIPSGEDGYIHLKVVSQDEDIEWWPSESEMYKIERPSMRELALFEGWNLIGLPLTPVDPSIEVVLANILDGVNSVWTFDGETKTWSSYSPGAPSNLVEMVEDRGYWIKMTEDATLTVQGESANTRELALFEGWNLIGLPLTPVDPSIEVVLANILNDVNSVWSFDGETKTWSSYAPGAPSNLNTMIEDRGYWIKVNLDCILTLYP